MSSQRDLRLDFFRGISLFMIFLDHIPDNFLAHFTLHSVGFNDAAEVFIFISGYTAAEVYGRAIDHNGFWVACAQIYRRIWQLYVAHLTLFMIYMAEVSFTLSRINNPFLKQDLRVGSFLTEPHMAIVKALILEFQPVFLDILPLYISLLALFPFFLWLVRKSYLWAMLVSLAIYIVANVTQIDLPAYPEGNRWFFDPLAWQLLFGFGAACGIAAMRGQEIVPERHWIRETCVTVAIICAFIRLSWEFHAIWPSIPAILNVTIWPWVDKTVLAPLRLVNFVAMAMLAAHWVTPKSSILTHGWAKRIIVCGQNSLYVFAFSILLSTMCRMVQLEFHPPIYAQVLYDILGFLLMLGLGELLMWYDQATHHAKPIHVVAEAKP